MAKPDFYSMYMPQAQAAAAQLNVPAEAILNQWGLETGWGKSVIPGTNNLGNIKDFSGRGTMATDNMTGSRDRYRQYASPDDFTNDYVNLIKTRYPKAMGSQDALAFGTALKAGGYAEDSNYARKVAGMPIESSSNSALPGARAAYDINDPSSVYQFWMQNQPNVKAQPLSPEQKAALVEDRQRQASMLPLSIGAALSGDKNIRALGSQMYNNAVGAQGAQKLGDYGWMTAQGDLIENPLRAADREENRQGNALNMAIRSVEAARLKQLGLDANRQNQNVTGENAAADDYAKNSKNDWTIVSAGQNLGSAPKTAAGDIAYIFQYMKMLDPTSVVREGEFATAQNAAGVPDQIRNMYNRVTTGERLNDTQRSQMQEAANALSETAYRRLEGQQDFYRDLSKRRGYMFENIVPSYQIRQKAAPPAGGNPSSGAPAQGGQATKQVGGKTYVKIDGQWYEQ